MSFAFWECDSREQSPIFNLIFQKLTIILFYLEQNELQPSLKLPTHAARGMGRVPIHLVMI